MPPTFMVANAVSSIGSALRIPQLILRAVLFLVSVNNILLPLTTTYTHTRELPEPSIALEFRKRPVLSFVSRYTRGQ
ncbi:hypothetical protein CTAM01_10648 [Colletotrichum tamarilloi]|uniref:Secreted protein n=1 Tax=Colletotrichum tamarilloi TaxID=1209934 RepID=A0ABQ9R025_9PEZI|nr:uncharacterized protein CTAM01_10648 [Colletotrichum tamarilloi]KAK1490722.1 hypothetical protein CTAM01_10648 [Colletotrichum tamarilloi]